MENTNLLWNVLIPDDFVTPSSTPPGEASEAAASEESNVFNEDLSDAALHDKIYDKLVSPLIFLQYKLGVIVLLTVF